VFHPFVGASTRVNQQVANAGIQYTALVPQVIRLRYVDTNVANDPLVVTVDNGGPAGEARISVQLAQDGSAVITSTATQVRAAILQHKVAGQLVNAVLSGDGTGVQVAVTEFAIGTDPDATTDNATAGYNNDQGGRVASLDLLQAGNADIHYEAKTPNQVAYTITYVVAGMNTAFSVTFSSPAITVNLATDGAGVATTTAKQLVDGFNADPDVNTLFEARLIPSPYGNDGAALAVAIGATAFVVGLTPGIVLDADLVAETLTVEWYEPANKS